MFSYYGTKKKLAPLYRKPKYDTLIEAFAGAAAYSLDGDNWKKQVILYDTNPKIVDIWDYLIWATPKDVSTLPDIKTGQKVTDFNLSKAEKYLIGFCINPGSSCPKITASQRNAWQAYKKYILENLHKIKHWKVFQQSYKEIPDIEATYFVDPPYQKAGKYYFGHKDMDFGHLGQWCKTRLGQVIACENYGANWLPFEYLTKHQGSIQSNVEVVWNNTI